LNADAAYVVVNLARQIQPAEVVLVGVNSAVPTAACLLAKRCYGLPFTHLNAAGGIDARPDALPASSCGPALLRGTAAIFNNEDFYDLCLRGGLDIAFLGAAQIDAHGRTNVSAIGDWDSPRVRLPGGGGAAAMMPIVRRAVVWQTAHARRGLVETVDFATAASASVVVTPWAVFERPPDGRFALASYRSDRTPSEIRAATAFAFVADHAVPTPPPTPAELRELTLLDTAGTLTRCFERSTLRPALGNSSVVAGIAKPRPRVTGDRV
jgi:glutaconate CoA-transferase subunit B